MCADFPRPLYPWPALNPQLAVDGAVVPPEKSRYEVGYWIEDGKYHVEIPKTSREIRNSAFLGDK